jgi:hypothetical protein
MGTLLHPGGKRGEQELDGGGDVGPDTFPANYTLPVLGATIILVASVLLAYWIHSNAKRAEATNRMQADADRERAELVLESARQATEAERELNDFIAYVCPSSLQRICRFGN